MALIHEVTPAAAPDTTRPEFPIVTFGRQQLILADCLDWLAQADHDSISAVLTDPPYGLVEYSKAQQKKLRAGRGGVWRIPPAFDGANRLPLPRFTVLDRADRDAIVAYFRKWGGALLPVLRPGAHVVIAGNPLVSPLVAWAMEQAGYERRGEIIRLVRTFRGGDRPKGAHEEFPMVSTMPRSCFEPWGLYRKPLGESTVSANLRRWGTGALRRPSPETPFLDVIESGTTPDRERAVAPHPSVKPQAFLRRLVRGLLPTEEGVVLDPFAGCATTLAACEALGVEGVGTELDEDYFALAANAIAPLASMQVGTLIVRATVDSGAFNPDAVLPYQLRHFDFEAAMRDVYDFFFDVNTFLRDRGLARLEETVRPAILSGVISDMLAASLAKHSRSLVVNQYPNGHPDLLVGGTYPGNAAKSAEGGVEVKTT